MFVIDVIPFSRASPGGTLSYRSRVALAPGALVSVMLRRTRIRALVVNCESVRDMKSFIKRSSFALSSSEPIKHGSLPKNLMTAARDVAEYHAAPLGSVLQALIGEYAAAEQPLVSTPKKYRISDHPIVQTGEELDVKDMPGRKRMTIEAAPADRAFAYRNIITKAIGGGNAVHLIVPTIAELLYWKDIFKDLTPLVLSGATSLKQRGALFDRARESTGLVITTPTYIWLPMLNRRQYIIDRVSAGTYSMLKRPYIDFRRAVEAFARAYEMRLCVGDYPLPLEYRTNAAAPLAALLRPTISLIDMRTNKITSPPAVEREHVPFKAVPDALLTGIRAEVVAGGRVGVLAVRKGYAPTVVCGDCGQAVQDDRGLPLSFTISGSVRSMRSIDGKTVRIADRLCVRCGSWNLVPLGIGIGRVEEELRKEFPSTPIVSIVAESLRTRANIRKLLEKTSTAGSIVIGTEAALPWLLLMRDEFPLTLGMVASADSLLSLPFWRARERFARLIMLFASLTQKVMIASRQPDDSVFSIIDTSAGSAFFSEETSLRRSLQYPPFGTLIALQIEGSLLHRDSLQAQVVSLLAPEQVTFLPDRPLTMTTARRTGIIHKVQGEWPAKALSQKIQSLGQSVRVLLDPESLW